MTRFYFKTLVIIGVSFIFCACNDRKKEPKIEKLSESERAYNKKEFEIKEIQFLNRIFFRDNIDCGKHP